MYALKPYQLKPVEHDLYVQWRAERFGRELVRAALAVLALILVIVTVVLSYHASQGGHWEGAKDWLFAVLPAETAILGSALGFYFGTQSDRWDQVK